MKKIIANVMVAIFALAGVCAGALPVAAESIFRCPDGTLSTTGDLNGCSGSIVDPPQADLMQTLNTVINVIVGVVGFIAVVMIVIGGIQYAVSAGDPGKTKKAKDTIMYGIIGLVVALLAFAIVNFVLTSVFK